MTHKKDNTRSPASAPELPGHVAKEYGLHHHVADVDEPAAMQEAEQQPAPDRVDTTAEAGESNEKAADQDEGDGVVADDSKLDAAVDDILKKESDELLAAHDAARAERAPVPVRRGFWRSIGRFFKAWWRNGWSRWLTILVLVSAITTAALIQEVRYSILNYVGVRSSASVIVLDNTTKLPLKNVTVTLNDRRSSTDIKGMARFSGLKMGQYKLTIMRMAFASYRDDVTIGWGSNPLGEFSLKAVGLQYTVVIKDYLSGKAIAGAEVITDEANALSDKDGKVVLTVNNADSAVFAASVGAAGYRSETIELSPGNTAETNVVLVPNQKDVFVSKLSGKYDIYSSDLDGKNRKLLLAGTGNENANMSLVVSPDGKRAAFVSTRDNFRDASGYLLMALTIINVETGTNTVVDHAEQIQLVDWLDNRLVYRTTTAGADVADSQRNRLVSLSYETNSRAQLATANQFNAILSAKGFIYYGVSSSDPSASLGLFRIKPDGSGRKQLSDKEVWTGLRATYTGLSIQTPGGWYSYNLGDDGLNAMTVPANITSYTFVDDSRAERSAWTDVRDGRGALLVYDIRKGTQTIIKSQEGLMSPFRWASDGAIVYRVSASGEAADYVISPGGGEAHKIADVTPVAGYSQAY